MGGVLSIGLYQGDDSVAGQMVDYAVMVNANCVFLFNTALRLAPMVKQRAPHVKLVGRGWWGNTEEQMDVIRSSNARSETYYRMAGLIDHYPEFDMWQMWNETYGAGDFEALRLLTESERGAADACADKGKLLLYQSAGPGTIPTKHPEDIRRADWQPWCDISVPMFTYRGVGGLSIHAYGGSDPVTNRMYRLNEAPEWFIARHEFFFDGLREDGIPIPDTYVTEYGTGQDWGKWLTEEQLAEDYIYYGNRLLKEPKIRAAFQFCTGDSGGWEAYDIAGTDVIRRMGDWNAAHPVPWTEPQQGEEEMPIDQAKIDQLLAQNALITDALVALREGRLTGADGVDGYIAALRGGQVPAGYAPVGPSYPPKN